MDDLAIDGAAVVRPRSATIAKFIDEALELTRDVMPYLLVFYRAFSSWLFDEACIDVEKARELQLALRQFEVASTE